MMRTHLIKTNGSVMPSSLQLLEDIWEEASLSARRHDPACLRVMTIFDAPVRRRRLTRLRRSCTSA